MAMSSRDKLREANAQSLKEKLNPKGFEQPTIFTDLDSTFETDKQDDIQEDINVEIKNTDANTDKQEDITVEKESKENYTQEERKKDDILEKNMSKVVETAVADKIIQPKKKSTKKTEPKLNKENFDAEKYTGPEISATTLMSEELWDYLQMKAIIKGVPIKKYFSDLLINEIENGNPDNDDPELLKAYRKTQHDTIKKTISIKKDLQEEIKIIAAKRYIMRHLSFMAYVVHKAMINDKDL